MIVDRFAPSWRHCRGVSVLTLGRSLHQSSAGHQIGRDRKGHDDWIRKWWWIHWWLMVGSPCKALGAAGRKSITWTQSFVDSFRLKKEKSDTIMWHSNTLTQRSALAFKQGRPCGPLAIAPDYHLGGSTALGIDADNPSEAGCLWMFRACRSHRCTTNGTKTHLQASGIALPFISFPIYVSYRHNCLARNIPLVVVLLPVSLSRWVLHLLNALLLILACVLRKCFVGC